MDKVQFTVFKSKGSLSKRYWLEDGDIKKQAAAQMSQGTAERVSMPFSKFPEALVQATDKQALGYGCHALSYPDKVNISVSGKESPADNVLSRTQRYFEYQNAPGILMFDQG